MNLNCSVIQNIQFVMYVYIILSFNTLPQLVPFFFLNQVIFAFILLVILIYAFSKYILPKFVTLFLVRVSLIKL